MTVVPPNLCTFLFPRSAFVCPTYLDTTSPNHTRAFVPLFSSRKNKDALACCPRCLLKRGETKQNVSCEGEPRQNGFFPRRPAARRRRGCAAAKGGDPVLHAVQMDAQSRLRKSRPFPSPSSLSFPTTLPTSLPTSLHHHQQKSQKKRKKASQTHNTNPNNPKSSPKNSSPPSPPPSPKLRSSPARAGPLP